MRNTLGGSLCRAVARRAFQAGGGNRVQYPPCGLPRAASDWRMPSAGCARRRGVAHAVARSRPGLCMRQGEPATLRCRSLAARGNDPASAGGPTGWMRVPDRQPA